ncbi:anti-sigma factor [Portibacter marinus]|uniref:anti-sigma factor n=1 Tax=Portibacter marinus TaxID=2898660 RepID=UPI001F36E38F|nr:anti-sigma factor [Portibacter marinus]
MKEDVKTFLESGLLEEYLMGTCNQEQVKRVEYYIDHYPEVKREYDELQEHIEKMSYKLAVNSPKGLKEAIISCLEDESDYKVKTNLSKVKTTNSMRYLPWAAAFIGIVASIVFYLQKQNLRYTNMEIYAEKNMAESQLEDALAEVNFLRDKLALSGHSKTERIVLAGNQLSPQFSSTAFWNDTAGKAILYINEPGEIDENHTYQIWADVDGRMINAGLLPKKPGPVELKYLENATSLNITIEPKGGSEHPNVERLVSSQNLLKI